MRYGDYDENKDFRLSYAKKPKTGADSVVIHTETNRKLMNKKTKKKADELA